MAKGKHVSGTQPTKKVRPALSEDAREKQLMSLAIDLVEQRLIDGTASSQETTHFLKLASSEARLKKKILEKEMELMEAKTQSIKSQQRSEELYEKALKAMRSYSGQDDSDDY